MIKFPKYKCHILFIFFAYFNSLPAETYNYDEEYEESIEHAALIPDEKYEELIKETMLENSHKLLDEGYSYGESAEITHPKTDIKKTFRFDCSGFVAAVYWMSDIVIFDKQASKGNTGVNIIYKTFSKYNKIYTNGTPNIGDIVMFDNTTKIPKPLSHCGIIVDIDDNDTITFIHASVSRGLVLGYINLTNAKSYKDDDGNIINSYLKRGSGTTPLASNCFNSFGTIFSVPKN